MLTAQIKQARVLFDLVRASGYGFDANLSAEATALVRAATSDSAGFSQRLTRDRRAHLENAAQLSTRVL